MTYIFFILYLFSVISNYGYSCNDITGSVFGNINEGVIAAFGDFNSDELTDVFSIENAYTTLQVLYGSETEPLLKRGPRCDFRNYHILSVVPGDFDGDALMDLLVVMRHRHKDRAAVNDIYINWGHINGLNCANLTDEPVIKLKGEPLALDFNRDMIIDLYGRDDSDKRVFWVFQNSRGPPKVFIQEPPSNDRISSLSSSKMAIPNANAYLDLNGDNAADLFVQTESAFEIWAGKTESPKMDFVFNHTIDISMCDKPDCHIGQALFIDLKLQGVENLLLPVCFSDDCSNSAILVHDGTKFQDLRVNFKDPSNVQWGFVKPDPDDVYLKTITARAGDYNMDGYPDLIVTLRALNIPSHIRTFILQNIPCKICDANTERTFEVQWTTLNAMGNNTVAGAFYDFYQDGVLDVVVLKGLSNGKYRPLAFRNTLDYDANFVKIIVLTGLTNKKYPTQRTPLGRKKRTYGTNLPGPRIVYTITTQDGDRQYGSSVQLPQSSYFALQLPYTIFGLGRTPNFIDSLTVGLGTKSRTWTQLIPNSQIIVVPKPIDEPQRWKAQLFVTPSKLILMSVFALGGTCLVIVLIILLLYVKEKREDKLEILQEAHRFHFDAM